MATEDQKKARLLGMVNTVFFGFAKGMYDLFGDSALATTVSIGEDIIEEMERELGLEIHGEDPQSILTELERLLVDEYDLMKSADLDIHPETHEVDIVCHECRFWSATTELAREGVPPYSCVPMMIASAALRKRLKKKAKFVGIKQNMETKTCDIDMHMID